MGTRPMGCRFALAFLRQVLGQERREPPDDD